MNERFVEQWGKLRAMGRTRYVLISGVLSWGVPMFLVMTFIVNRRDRGADILAISAVLWLFGGALYGWLMWVLNERKFRKLSSEAQASREM